MNSSTQFFPPDFFPQIIASSTTMAVEFLRLILRTMWSSFQPYLFYIIGFFFLILVIATIKAMFGQWGLLGSIVYHVIFCAILGLIIVIWGLEILFNSYFELITALVYLISYRLAKLIIRRFKYKY